MTPKELNRSELDRADKLLLDAARERGVKVVSESDMGVGPYRKPGVVEPDPSPVVVPWYRRFSKLFLVLVGISILHVLLNLTSAVLFFVVRDYFLGILRLVTALLWGGVTYVGYLMLKDRSE